MGFENFETKESSEGNIDSEESKTEEFEDSESKSSLGDKIKEGINKLFNKGETTDADDSRDEEDASDDESKLEKADSQDTQDASDEKSLGDKLKDGINKLFNRTDTSEDKESSNEESSDAEDSEQSKETHVNQILDTNDSRREMRDSKLEAYDKQLTDSLTKHGEMLERRSDLSPDEKNDLQAEATENYKKALSDYKDWLENESDYRDLPEE